MSLVLRRDYTHHDPAKRQVVIVTPAGPLTVELVGRDRRGVAIAFVDLPDEVEVWRGEVWERIVAESPERDQRRPPSPPPLSAGLCQCVPPHPVPAGLVCGVCRHGIDPRRLEARAS